MTAKTKQLLSTNARILAELALGSLIYSLGMNVFYTPLKLLPGGVAGAAQLIHYRFGLPTSLMILLINIPMFLIGLRFVSKKFTLYSLLGMGIFTLSIQLFSGLSWPTDLSPLTCIVLGGVLTGFGLGLIYRSGASVGGTDMIAKALYKYFSFNMAVTGLIFNILIISIFAVIYGLDKAVLTVCTMVVATYVNTYVIDGIDHRRAILIVTERQHQVAQGLMDGLNRGVTVLDSHGAYTGKTNNMLYCVISKHQLQQLKGIVKKADPRAFFCIIPDTGVYGRGHEFFDFNHIEN